MPLDNDRIGPIGEETQRDLSAIFRAPGNDHARNNFASRYHGRIFSYCRSLGLDENAAEDATQDVLVKLFLNLRVIVTEQKNLPGWLKVVIRHRVVDDHRLRRKAHESLETIQATVSDEHATDPEELLSRMEQELVYLAAVEKIRSDYLRVKPGNNPLKLEHRAKVWELFCEIQQNKQNSTVASEVLGISPAAIHTEFHRIRQRIKREAWRLLSRGRSDNAPRG
ncbi:MAG: sigma-70 family RNA polymerase sigma factor [Isosphaeraceae bacterium]